MRLGKYYGGWKRDTPEKAAKSPLARGTWFRAEAPVPARAHLLDLVSVLDQGQLGACVFNASAQALRIALQKAGHKDPPWLSRLFGYHNTLAMEGGVFDDTGVQPADAFLCYAQLGFCEEKYWPYDPDKLAERPPEQAYQHAFDQRWMRGYARIAAGTTHVMSDVQHAIAAGHAVTCGLMVDTAFENYSKDVYKPGGKRLGGHYVCGVGYDARGLWIVNSWGSTEWGVSTAALVGADGDPNLRGFAILPWHYVRAAVDDLYVVQAAPFFSEEDHAQQQVALRDTNDARRALGH